MSSIAPIAWLRSNWPVTSLTISTPPPPASSPCLTPSTRWIPTSEPGMPEMIASLPRFPSSFVM